MSLLSEKKCVPCQGGIPALKAEEIYPLLERLGNNWKLVEEHHIEKTFSFSTYREALDFTLQVGNLAEEENHHPEIYLGFRTVEIKIWTHKINGLVESDFILASKIDLL